MLKLRRFIAFSGVLGTLFSSSVFAFAGLPLSVGVHGGITHVEYKKENEIAFFWAVTGNLRLNDFSSIYSGYTETTSDIPDANGVEQKFKSIAIPLAIQINIPILLGNAYVRGGGSYYQNTYGQQKDDGLGFLGAVGVLLSPGIGPSVAIEFSYEDRGNAKTSTIAMGAKFGF